MVIIGVTAHIVRFVFLARANFGGKQQFAQHLFLHRSSAVSYAPISCVSESGLLIVRDCGGEPLADGKFGFRAAEWIFARSNKQFVSAGSSRMH